MTTERLAGRPTYRPHPVLADPALLGRRPADLRALDRARARALRAARRRTPRLVRPTP